MSGYEKMDRTIMKTTQNQPITERRSGHHTADRLMSTLKTFFSPFWINVSICWESAELPEERRNKYFLSS